MRAHRDLLGAQNFLNRPRPPRSGFHGRVVGNDDGFPALHPANGGYDPRRRRAALILVVSDEQPDFLLIRILVEKQIDSFARRQLMGFVLFSALVGTAPNTTLCFYRALFFRHPSPNSP